MPKGQEIEISEDTKTETFQYQVPSPPLHMSRGVKATEPAERGPQMYSGFPSLSLSILLPHFHFLFFSYIFVVSNKFAERGPQMYSGFPFFSSHIFLLSLTYLPRGVLRCIQVFLSFRLIYFCCL